MEPAPVPAVLEYSIPSEAERRWGPVVFRPSWKTVLLLVLTAGTVCWLVRRQHPWRLVAMIPCNYLDAPYSPQRSSNLCATFTPDGLLLFDSEHGARLYDPAAGALLHTVLPTIDRKQYHYYAFTRSRHVLLIPNEGGVATLYDFAGTRIGEFPDLGRNGNEVVISHATPTVLYRDRLHIRLPLVVQDLTGTSPNVSLYRPDLADSDFRLEQVRFSADGTMAVVGHWAMPDIRDSQIDVFNLRTGKTVGQPIHAKDWPNEVLHGFIGPNEVLLSSRGDSASTTTFSIRAVNGGGTRHVVVPLPSVRIRQAAISDDGALLATYDLRSRAVEVRGTHSGKLVATRATPIGGNPAFFPGSHRMLTFHSSQLRHVVADPHHDQPLAVLPWPEGFKFAARSLISPDGRTIVVSPDPSQKKVVIYRNAGWDCPESHLGALAFPHVWLLCILFTAAVVSAARDARRARVDSASPPPELLPYALILVALPVTLYFIIAAALGRWTLNPAPALLLAGIGLATRSCVWRFVALVLLAATLGWCIYLLNAVRNAGVKQSSLYALFDREYVIPHLLPAIGLGLAIVLCAASLFLLARRARVQTLAAPGP